MRIGIAGLSHLGLVTGVCIASRGVQVVGYDSRSELIQQLRTAKLPVVEPQLDNLVQSSKDHLEFTNDIRMLAACEVIYVALDVATNEENESSLQGIHELTEQLIPIAARGSTIVIHSQVPPGYTRALDERWRTHTDTQNITILYQVETLIFGNAVQRALEPERYIIGCRNPRAPLPESYLALLQRYDCPLLPMRYESAELAKISINMFLVSTVTTTNTIAELCEHIGADWGEIAQSLRLDRRIGQHAYLQPGLGIAGGNLERDLVSFQQFSRTYGTDSDIVRAWIANSRYRRDWTLRTLHREVLAKTPDAKIAVWGVAYKAGTHSVKNSPSVALLRTLEEFSPSVYDPAVPPSSLPELRIHWTTSALACCSNADVLVIMTPWPEFSKVGVNAIKSAMRGRILIDPFAVISPVESQHQGLTTFSLGQTPNTGAQRTW